MEQGTGALTEYIDVAQVSLYVFWIFFAWLIYYIRRTDRREGYPLETDYPRRVIGSVGALIPKQKEYRLPHGEPSYFAPPEERDEDPVAAQRVAAFAGAALKPTGENPMLDRIGPATYAKRKDKPELTFEGHNLIQPMTKAGFSVAKEDKDPRGYEMVGADDQVAGTVTEIWVDVSDQETRFLEVDTGGKKVLTPMALISVDNYRERCRVYAILGEQFKDVPQIKSAVTCSA
ncbi:MAG: photosynthetic reaction center subunit H, partial [Myxococcota bacterium]